MASSGAIVNDATGQIGQVPYKLGASMAATASKVAADCSSFVKNVFANQGITLPRTADQQYKATMTGSGGGTSVSLNALQPGDLVFMGGFNTPDNKPGYAGIQHVAIYAGNGKVVGEGNNGSNVSLDNLSAFGSHVIAATRVNGVDNTTASGGTLGTGTGSVKSTGGFNLLGFVTDPIANAVGAASNSISTAFLFGVVVLIGIALLIVGGMMVTKTSGGDVVGGAVKIGAAA
jgi:hypothetical protein